MGGKTGPSIYRPYANSAVAAGRQDTSAVRTERDAGDGVGMAWILAERRSITHIPQPGRCLVTTGKQQFSIRRIRNRGDGGHMRDSKNLSAGLDVPELYRSVPTAG